MRLLALAVLLVMSAAGRCCAADVPVGRTGYIESDGLKRRYWLHLPGDRTPAAGRPLVVVLHGAWMTGRGMVKLTGGGFDRLSDRENLVVVYPDGVDKFWNDGKRKIAGGANDLKFLLKLIARMRRDWRIDRRNVFVCGFSNGGFMSMRLAHDRPGVARAIASVGASVGTKLAQERRPRGVPALLILGTEDPVVPYKGGDIVFKKVKRGLCLSAVESAGYWRAADGCGARASREPLPDRDRSDGTRAIRTTWDDCRGGTSVRLVSVAGGGHTWPSGYQYLSESEIGRTSRDFDAAEEIWAFFSRRIAKPGE